jgi:hypothetical protein
MAFEWLIPPNLRDKPTLENWTYDAGRFPPWQIEEQKEPGLQRIEGPDKVYLPGWGDIVHITPSNGLSEEEQRRKKQERLKRMMRSPLPQWYQTYTEWMTWLDDIDDLLTTIIVIGRIIIPRIAPRLVPYIGWAILLADILDFISLTAGFDLVGALLKFEHWKNSFMNPFSKKGKWKRLKKLGRKIPRFGELLEVAQTTDNLFGIGISLGPLMGAGAEVPFGIAKGAEFYWFDHQIGKTEVMSQKVAIAGGWMMQGNPVLSPEENRHVLTAMIYAQVILAEVNKGRDLDSYVDMMDMEFTPPPCLNCITREVLKEAGIDPDATKHWPLPGNPERVTVRQTWESQAKLIAEAQKTYIDTAEYIEEEWFIGAAMVGIAEQSMINLEGDLDDVAWTPTEDTLIWMRIAERGILPPPPAPRLQWEIFIRAMEDYKRQHTIYPTRNTLKGICIDFFGKYYDTYTRKVEPGGIIGY